MGVGALEPDTYTSYRKTYSDGGDASCCPHELTVEAASATTAGGDCVPRATSVGGGVL